jgi:chromate transporter
MLAVGIVYRSHGDHNIVTAMLKGLAAAAAGLLLATVIQLCKKSLSHQYDLIFVLVTVLAVNRLHQSVPHTLIVVGLLATLWYHPRKTANDGGSQ